VIDKAVIISTGDELTEGRVTDVNSAVIAERLSALGVDIAAILKVGDDRTRLHWALGQGQELSDLIIGTGGLGPTANDLTAEVVAEFLGRKLHRDEDVARSLLRRFEARDLSGSVNNLKQARFPEGAVVISNVVGTAFGFRIAMDENKSLIWLSGIPREMVTMLSDTVIPWIVRMRTDAEPVSVYTAKIHGLTESKLADRLKSLSLSEGTKLSFRDNFPDLSLRLTVKGKRKRAATFESLKSQIKEILAPYIYAEGDETLEEVVGQLLLVKQKTLALAESCTGGYISHRITRVPGSSVYYCGGAVTYSNDAKIRYLGVHPHTLQEHGAVSRETALEMSAGIRERLTTSIGVSVTGIAGPSGGTAQKPVGTVWISIAGNDLHEARHFLFYGDRERVILGTSQAALDWLRMTLRDS
jgi:nicotinamide-nucleotide amidase